MNKTENISPAPAEELGADPLATDSVKNPAAPPESQVATPEKPVLRPKLHVVDLTFSVVFLAVGVATVVGSLGASIPLWELGMALLGIAGVVLLVGAFITALK